MLVYLTSMFDTLAFQVPNSQVLADIFIELCRFHAAAITARRAIEEQEAAKRRQIEAGKFGIEGASGQAKPPLMKKSSGGVNQQKTYDVPQQTAEIIPPATTQENGSTRSKLAKEAGDF